MELMSMLLFCAFVLRLPPALGIQSESEFDVQAKFYSSILDQISTLAFDADHRVPSMSASGKDIKITEPNPFLTDDRCKYCSCCVEKALTAKNPELNELQNRTKINKKLKRNAPTRNWNFTNADKVEDNKSKSLTVTKYKTTDEKVYAIKVNEINNQISEPNDGKSNCKVYSVKKAYPCESEESNLILMNRKVNKKRISKPKNTSTSTEKSIARITSTGFKKRKLRVESSHVPESFMPSIEELY